MSQIDLNDLQKRKLEKYYLAWYIIDKEITIRDENCIQKKILYTIYGVDILGNRQVIGVYFEKAYDNRFWLETFEDIQARGAETALFLVTPAHHNIERCSKIVYNSIRIVHSPDDVILSITKFFSEKPTRALRVSFKNLFLADDLDKYKLELQLFKEQYINNKVIMLLLQRKEPQIQKFYDYSYELRKFFYPYYAILEMRKYLNKLNNLKPLCSNLTDVIEVFLPYINKFEAARSYYKKEWLDLVSILYDKFPEDLEVYLDG